MRPLAALPTEQQNPASIDIDKLSSLDMVRVIHAEDTKAVAAVNPALPLIAEAIDRISARMKRGGRLFYIGAGTSGRLGVLDASECAPTYNVSPDTVQGIIAGGQTAVSQAREGSEDDSLAGAEEITSRAITPNDTICGIAASGRTPYVLGAVRRARELGALTVGLSCVRDSELGLAAELAITVETGPEVITGSTRMKAGTATKLVLNMISTGAMIRLGYTYGNLMVNVQPKNEKLVDRATRIIAAAGRVDSASAAQLLDASGRSVRTAIVMARLGVSREAAEVKLRDADYVVARALGEI
jgi:N-acetylmuramic acid 6-phosphate etherase